MGQAEARYRGRIAVLRARAAMHDAHLAAAIVVRR